jgi:hypothetical protein
MRVTGVLRDGRPTSTLLLSAEISRIPAVADDLPGADPIAGFQQGKACDPRYYTRFTKLQRCPK